MPNKNALRHEMRSDAISSEFSLDRLIDGSVPPDCPLTYIRVSGPVSYDAESPVKHGDYIGVIPDKDDHPEALLLVRIGPSYFIRRRHTIEWMIRRFSMYLVGHIPSPKKKLFEVIGLVICVTHFPPGSPLAVEAMTIPQAYPPVAMSGPIAGQKRREIGGEEEDC